MDLSSIKAFDVEIDEKNIIKEGRDIVQQLRPEWKSAAIKEKVFTDGITNKLVGFYYESKADMILIRVYGKKSELLIDRDTEKRNMLIMFNAGLAPELFASFKNGLAYGFAVGKCPDEVFIKKPVIFEPVTKLMAKMHNCRVDDAVPENPVLFKKLRKYFNVLPKDFDNVDMNQKYHQYLGPKGTQLLKDEIDRLEVELTKLNSPIVFCHNDLLLNNIVFNEESKKVTFIDYEYGDYNYQAYDLGNHFDEFAGVDEVDYSRYPTKEFQIIWLRKYLEAWYQEIGKDPATISAVDVERLYVTTNKFALAAHLYWGLWGILQAKHSLIDFDFLGYAIIRLTEYFNKCDTFLALKMP